MTKLEELVSKMDYCTHKYVKLYNTKYKQELKPKELNNFTAIELGILNLIQWKEDRTLKEIGGVLAAPNSTLTSAIDRLEKKEVLYRTIHPKDKRTFKLELTKKGKEIIKLRIDHKKKILSKILLALDDDQERELFLHLLEKIYSNIQ